MENLAIDALLAQLWQVVVPYVSGAWGGLQSLFAQAPTALFVGIAIGLVLAQVLRVLLIVAGVAALVYVAARVFGGAVPGL